MRLESSSSPRPPEEKSAERGQRTPTLLGLDLPVRETHYPREGYEPEGDTPPVSSLHEELPPEVIEYDNHIPLIASPGMDRRRPRTEFSNPALRDREERSRALRDEVDERLREPVSPPDPSHNASRPAAPVFSSSSILGLNSPTADELGATESASTALREETPVPSVTTDQKTSARGHFLDFSEPERSHDLHGPSFLGLSSSPEEYEDTEPPSHARRNFALLVLLIIAVLIGLQWRSIRDFGVKYAQSGGIHIPGMKGAEPANNNTGAAGSQAGAAGTATQSGQGPNMEVAPRQNQAAGADVTRPLQEGKTLTDDAPPSAHPASENKTPAGKTKEMAASRNDADRIPQNEPADEETASGPDTAAPVAKQRPRQPVDDTMQFGAAELNQANSTSDLASKASLLWKSTSKGNPIAPVQLAELYLTGQGVAQDCEQALVLLRSASAKKNPRARSKLGSLYATGQCVEKDRVQAYHWMSLALQVNPGSEWVERNRQSLWAQMTPEERRRAARDR